MTSLYYQHVLQMGTGDGAATIPVKYLVVNTNNLSWAQKKIHKSTNIAQVLI